MGRHHEVIYVCDWCGDKQPPRVTHDEDEDEPPEGWVEMRWDCNELLCPPCQEARKEALAAARMKRFHTRQSSGFNIQKIPTP